MQKNHITDLNYVNGQNDELNIEENVNIINRKF